MPFIIGKHDINPVGLSDTEFGSRAYRSKLSSVKARIKATEASIETANITLEEERNNIILGVRKVYRNLLNLQNQIEISRQSVINAQLTYDLNLERYKNGDLTGMDLNIYQNQLSEKQLTYTNSLITYKLELLNLKIQTLYDFEKKVAVSPVMTLENNR